MTKLSRKPLEKRPLYREEIGNAIRNAIFAGELRPGDRIVETQWARELGVSQSPVREAIRELEMIGLVENIPYQGCFVRKVTKQDMKDNNRVRTYLEMLGIEDAVLGATEEQLNEILRIYDDMVAAAKKNAVTSYVKCNELFHQRIIEISQNKLLIRLWMQCHFQDSTFFTTNFSGRTLEELAARHKEIYDAIEARDIDHAKQVVYRHFQELNEELETEQE